MSYKIPLHRIVEARESADADALSAEFRIDWSRANLDKRKGRVHGWKVTGEYVGQFTSHESAGLRGAVITRIDRTWFDWREK